MTGIEEYLNQIPMWAARKNSLKDIREFLKEMGNPDASMKIIHVAGTNGKGSVCTYLTSMLKQAGFRVGTFVSPHLEVTRERFLTDGNMVEEELYKQAFCRVRELSETMTARGFKPPTYFEFLFYMFMDICEKCRPDFVILETGLGGRLDVTNVVEHPVLTVITSISMDHMQYLGNTIEEIAGEKAGILKKEVPVVYDACLMESRMVIEERAKELNCPEFPVTEQDYSLMERTNLGPKIAVFMPDLAADGQEVSDNDNNAVSVMIPSQAEYQLINVTVAVRAVSVLRNLGICRITRADIEEGIRKSYWPGRMEEVLPDVWLDGAHNEGGIQALKKTIGRLQKETGKSVSIMFGAVSDKDHHRMIKELCDGLTITHVTIAHIDSERCASTEKLAEEFREFLSCPVEVFSTVRQAWECFLKEKGDGLAFCAGSLYLAGEVKSLLKEEQDD